VKLLHRSHPAPTDKYDASARPAASADDNTHPPAPNGGKAAAPDWNGTAAHSGTVTVPSHADVSEPASLPADVQQVGEDAQQPASGGERRGIVLEARDVSERVSRRRRTLQNVSLVARPRELVAIVGASGAGKSTLLRALAGVNKPSSGEVLLNALPLYSHLSELRTSIGYVPQDDIIHRRLRVDHALGYAAALRLPRDLSKKERRARVDEVIEQLGLEPQRKMLVGNLSGGQRKRVSIGVELLTRPELFFLDEPTAGLDPGTERRMMETLRGLADAGRTVLLVTHATHNIKRCDKVVFLTTDGRLAFFGTPSEALQYFDVDDFEEIYDRLETERTPVEWETRYTRSPYQPETALPDQEVAALREADVRRTEAKIEPGRQFGILCRRYADTLLHDRKQMLLLLLQAPLLGLLLFALFQPNALQPEQGITVLARNGNNVRVVQRDASGQLVGVQPNDELLAVQGSDCTTATAQQTLPQDCSPAGGGGNNRALKGAQFAFILAAIAVWLGTLNAIREIAREDPIYRRERLVGLRVFPYVLSKLAVLTVLVLIQSTLLLGVVKARVDVPVYRHILSFSMPGHLGGVQMVHIPYPSGPLDGVWLALVLAGVASVAVALAVSAAVSNPDRAVVAAPLLMVPQILFAGGLTAIHDLGPAKPLSYIVATRWGYEAIGRVVHVVNEAAVPQNFPYADQLRGDAVSRWLILLAFVAIGTLAAVVLQRRKA
jgi:ABC-type multidrug transport system ATPase subunit